jgi:hypothetical protein
MPTYVRVNTFECRRDLLLNIPPNPLVPGLSLILFDEELQIELLGIINDLIPRIPELTDFEILMGLYRSIAILNDCHSIITLPLNYVLPVTYIPHFDEQHSETSYPFPWPHIRDAYIGIDSAANSRLIAINGVGIDEIYNRMRPIFPHENEVSFRVMANWNLHNRDMLRYIEVIDDESIVPITVRDVNGAEFTVYAPFVRSLNDVDVTFHENDDERLFSWSRISEDYWFNYFPEESLMYIRIWRFATGQHPLEVSRMSVAERDNLPCVQFTNELIGAITEQSGVSTLVIDLRGNRGGMPFEGINRFFAWTQVEENRSLLGSVYIAIDSFTYSQAVVHSVIFSNYIDNAILIGAPASGALNFFGAGEAFVMPNSQTVFWTRGTLNLLDPYTETNTLYPDIFVYRTLEDFVNHHDAVIEAIRQRHATDND